MAGQLETDLVSTQGHSSINLYHFTDVNGLKGIIQKGFWFKSQDEAIPIEGERQEVFAVSFCDIRKSESNAHRKDYGHNALVFSKVWGRLNRISPVTYIHENSFPLNNRYRTLKHFLRGIRAMMLNEAEKGGILTETLFLSLYFYSTKFIEDYEKAEPIFSAERKIYIEEFERFIQSLSPDIAKIFEKYVASFALLIGQLNNELETRDLFTRTYEDDIVSKIDRTLRHKILYDEREWRAVKFWSYSTLKTDPRYIEIFGEEKRLPDEENLRFSSSDIVAILVENEKSVKEIKEFIRTERTLLNYEAVKDKIFCIDDFSEAA